MWPIRDHYYIFNLTKKSLFSVFIGPKTFFFGIVFCVKLWTFDYPYVRLWTFLSFLFVCSQHFWTFYTDSVCFGTFKTKDLPCSFVCVERWLVLRVPACPSSPTTHYPTLLPSPSTSASTPYPSPCTTWRRRGHHVSRLLRVRKLRPGSLTVGGVVLRYSPPCPGTRSLYTCPPPRPVLALSPPPLTPYSQVRQRLLVDKGLEPKVRFLHSLSPPPFL